MRYLLFCVLLPLFACNIKPDKSESTTNNNRKPAQDTIPSVTAKSLRVDTFNIVSLIPEFSKDSNFHSISGINVGTDIQKSVIYNIYRLPKKRVFDILKIKSKDKIDNKVFFKNVYSDYENNPFAQNFYDKLRHLKEYDIFSASTYGYMHWLFIDKNSDTIYQRTQLITF